jgi:hypothetical protein
MIDNHDDTYLRDISYPLGGAEYFRNFTEFNRKDKSDKDKMRHGLPPWLWLFGGWSLFHNNPRL